MVINTESELMQAIEEEGKLEEFTIAETYNGRNVAEPVYKRITELDNAIMEYLRR